MDSSPTASTTLAARSARASLKRARALFSNNKVDEDNCDGSDRLYPPLLVPPVDKSLHRLRVARLIRSYYPVIPADDGGGPGIESGKGSSLTMKIIHEMREEAVSNLRAGGVLGGEGGTGNKKIVVDGGGGQLVLHREVDIMSSAGVGVGAKDANTAGGASPSVSSTALALPGQKVVGQEKVAAGGILVKKKASVRVPTPKWHPPWRLMTVISSHLGWVRSIAFDPTNDMFATGAADRVIKIFDLAKACVGAEDALKITLTGHISPIRGLAFSERHPYLFSAGEDKMVKCWDLETNQVVRHYHGHLSGVFCLKLHPTLDLMVTGGRDAVGRVWDIRSKQQVHCLEGHDNTIGALLTKTSDPQVITGSYDSTIKLWDLAAGKCMTTLTHHKKAIRALAQPSFENTFLSGAADTLKKWQGRDGKFIKNFTGHNAVINALALNDDGVLLSASDNGTMKFWDYESGYCFQDMETIAQPGSLDAENGIFVSEFDLTGTRLITGEADKTIKIWKQDEEASDISHPIDMVGWRKQCLRESKQRC